MCPLSGWETVPGVLQTHQREQQIAACETLGGLHLAWKLHCQHCSSLVHAEALAGQIHFASTSLHGSVELPSLLLMPPVVGPLALSLPSQPHRWQLLLISCLLKCGLEWRCAAGSFQPGSKVGTGVS